MGLHRKQFVQPTSLGLYGNPHDMADMKNTSRLLYAGRYLELLERDGWELVSRHHPVVVLIAWTPADELLLVEQYRIPLGRRTIELPAGLVGDEPGREHEPLLEAARRELEEETGWRAGRLEEIIRCPSSAGLTDEMVIFMQAGNLSQVSAGGGDETEDIIVHAIARDRIDAWLGARNAAGLAIDSKIFTALYWAQP